MRLPVTEAMARYGADGVTVSVIIITYNHERFIAESLDSVLMQQVSFAVEIIVSEDCSTDDTRAVLHDYQARYPDVIRLVFSEQNINTNDVTTRALKMARGRYVAVFDGDDYWLAPEKLQWQVDFLERHPECAISYHSARVTFDARDRPDEVYPLTQPAPFAGLAELTAANMMPTSAVLYRADPMPVIPDWYRDLPYGDWPLHIIFARQGQIAYQPGIWSAYRVHAGGYWSGLYRQDIPEATVRSLMEMDDLLDAELGYQYTQQYRLARAFHWSLLLRGPQHAVPFTVRLTRLATYFQLLGLRRELFRRSSLRLIVQAISPRLWERLYAVRRAAKRLASRSVQRRLPAGRPVL